VGETDDLVAVTGNDCVLPSCGMGQSTSPHLLAISDDVPIKVGVQIGTSVVTSPAVDMERGDGVCVAIGRVKVPHG
jgi:hypothetical protein